ncbi:MAG: hypothetical protein H6618_08810 [Deltaproteobacteria bacterium]|nr:hypothetical protein [Deltaproteobacteria bacterium]
MLRMPEIIQLRLGDLKSRDSVKRYLALGLIASSITSFAGRRVTTNEGNTTKSIAPKELTVPAAWEKLLDPNQKEFWSEGNHVPDAGFLEWATNPTVENAKLFLIRMNAKRDRLHVMVRQQEQANKELIAAGVIADDYDFLAEHFYSGKKEENQSSKDQLDQQASHIWFYFHPACQHCKRQAEILKGNPNVFSVQVGGETLHHFQGLQKSLWAEKDDLQRYVPDGQVPILIVYNAQTNKLASLKGVQSIASINKVAIALGSEATMKGGKK